MPTYAELQAEPWWGREIVTVELDWAADELCLRTGRPRVAAGTKGDEFHLYGGHRSQEWILNSRYCTGRTYTVQSGLTGEQPRHIAALDFTPGSWGTAANRALMVAQTGRLVTALKAGIFGGGVTEVIGTLDGRTVYAVRVNGSTFSADTSHLDHWHMTFDRRRMTDRALMERVVSVALGEDNIMAALTDAQQTELYVWVRRMHQRTYAMSKLLGSIDLHGGEGVESVPMSAALTQLLERPTTVALTAEDRAAIVEGLRPAIAEAVRAEVASLRAGIEVDTRDAVADLGEGGATAVRADAAE